MPKEPNNELSDLTVKQTKNHTDVTIDGEKFMVWKYGTDDPCVNLNIGSYTEFTFLDEHVDAMIKFLRWYEKNKHTVKIVETPKKRYNERYNNDF